jgi:CheY-like chemotaxis protein
MDINLPDTSGLAAMKMLREHPATAHIPVIALSSDAYPRQIAEGFEAGFFRYLTKPLKVNELMDAIDVALRYAAESLPTN